MLDKLTATKTGAKQMILVTGYKYKKDLKASVGKRLSYKETSAFSDEYKSNGSFAVAHRPKLGTAGREFFAQVTMKDDLIVKVD